MRAILLGTGPGLDLAPLDDADLIVGVNGSARIPGVHAGAVFDLAVWPDLPRSLPEVWVAPDHVSAAMVRFPHSRIEPLGTVEVALRCPRIGGVIATMLGAVVTAAKRGASEIHVYGAPMEGGPDGERRWPLERQRFSHVAEYVRAAYGAIVWRCPARATVPPAP